MLVDEFSQQIDFIQGRLERLYQGVCSTVELEPARLPLAFKQLGVMFEELQVAMEELQQQNEALANMRQALDLERQRYHELFDLAPDAYLITNTLGIIQEANFAVAKLLNVSQRFLFGKPLLVYVAQEQRQMFYNQLLQMQSSEQVKEWVLSLCPRDGQQVKASVTATVVRDRQGEVKGLRLCIREAISKQHSDGSSQWKQADLETNDYPANVDWLKQVYLKGETISLNPRFLWLVQRGIVRLSTISETGEEVLLGLAGRSMAFGADLTSQKTYQATAVCEVELLGFSLKDLESYPQFAQKILPTISQRLKQTEALLAISGYRHAQDRLYHLLQLLKQEVGQPVENGTRLSIRLTHQDLAAACSTTRVTITRMLGKLQDRGKIAVDSQNLIIVLNDQK